MEWATLAGMWSIVWSLCASVPPDCRFSSAPVLPTRGLAGCDVNSDLQLPKGCAPNLQLHQPILVLMVVPRHLVCSTSSSGFWEPTWSSLHRDLVWPLVRHCPESS